MSPELLGGVIAMRNALHAHYGTTSPFIRPARRVIFSVLMDMRPNGCATAQDDRVLWSHFHARYGKG